ncbi:MAG TPA: DMT family transporter [Chitinophagaceae bacterium]|nr:DMT family transporter [Chitinophagaceae bacterium]
MAVLQLYFASLRLIFLMDTEATKKSTYTGIALALITTIIWSGNFIIARDLYERIPPVSLAFYRWALASVIIFFLGYKKFIAEKNIVFKNWRYFFWVALMGITLFNTFIYVAGHTTSATNMALIGTTAAPIFAIIISAIFLKEAITPLRITGLLFCIAGVIVLLSKGSMRTLFAFRFTSGDVWILLAAFVFSIYTVLVKRKPSAISPATFLFVVFIGGTLLLLPFFIIEAIVTPPVIWDSKLFACILYLGIGASVIAFFCWNAAIARIGAVRTALFGNLIPVFSTLEAVWLLGETITTVHIVSGALVIIGLVLANLKNAQGKQGRILIGSRINVV